MSFLNDFIAGLRQMRKHPGSAILAVIAYAAGLGMVGFALTFIFGIVRAHPESVGYDEIQYLRWDPSTEHLWKSGAQDERMRYPDFRELHEEQEVFESLAAYRDATFNVLVDDFAERFIGTYVTADFFDVLQIQPQIGRLFAPGDDAPGSVKKAVISDSVWRNEFSADESIVGASITIDGVPTQIIGVAAPNVDFPSQNDFWVNETLDPLKLGRAEGERYSVFGQLAPQYTTASALPELNTIAKRMEASYPETNTGYIAFDFRTLTAESIGETFTRLFYLIFACSLLVLLIACTNVANLMLSRATTRVKELAIRSSLGGRRSRLVNQMVVEGLSIALVGGLGGLIIAIWTSKAFWYLIVANAEVTSVPLWMNMDVDIEVIAALSLITLLASVVASIVPAIKASRANVNEILKDNSRGATGLKIGAFSKLLAFFQLCVSCGLLIATSAMVSSAKDTKQFEPPYDPSSMMVARFDIPESFGDWKNRAALLQRLQQRMEANPALEGVGFTSSYDMLVNWSTRWDVRGRERATNDDFVSGRQEVVSDNYFELLDIPILYGRGFEAIDSGENAEQVCIVNSYFAEKVWPGESPVGKQIRDVWDESFPWLTVIGVVPDTKMAGPGEHDPDELAGVYRPMSTAPQSSVTVFAKTTGNPILQANAIRAVLLEEAPNLALYRVKTVDQAVEEHNLGSRFFRNIFGLLGIAALALASIGVYGVMNFSVRQRFQEFGIRQALGAGKSVIIAQVFRLGIVQTSIGITLGVVMGWVLVKGIGQALGGVSAGPLNYLLPVTVILAIAALALFIPAREVTRVNLADCLRDE